MPRWDGSHGVVCAQGWPLRTQQELENHHSGTRVRRALESSGHIYDYHGLERGVTIKVTQRREAELGQATRAGALLRARSLFTKRGLYCMHLNNFMGEVGPCT